MKVIVYNACALILSACAAAAPANEVPARIVDASAASRAELLSAVSASLRAANVTLANEALTASSSLIVERRRSYDAAGRQLNGRDREKPQHFRLLLAKNRCVLLHEESGRRTVLPSVTCEAVAD